MFKRYKDWDEDYKIVFFTGLIMAAVWGVFIYPALCYSFHHFGEISAGWQIFSGMTSALAFICLFLRITEWRVERYFTKKRILKEIAESELERKAFENFAKHHYGSVIKIGDNIKIEVSPDGGFIYRDTIQ